MGGKYRMSFTNFGTGHTHCFGGVYLELRPCERIAYTDVFEDPGLPEVVPVEMCYLGWQESLLQVARLVEPEIS